MKKEEVTTINIKNFPMDLYVKVKGQAAKEHRTLKGLLINALEEYLERREKGGK